ncbi:hypothetical protein [Streptomyces sp. NPDC020681]|uniref:hypothetical protein n=1 Tax=Streptomyces sp. NPDC020681 TaxID=3365083 RepID=UPI00378E546F
MEIIMKNGQVALALAGGYILGRAHKMRWALALAGATAAGKGLGAGRIAAGAAKSPELARLTQDLRGQLATAGRKAAVATASNRIDSLSDRLQSRAESLRTKPGAEEPEEPEDEAGAEEPEEPEDEADADEPDAYEESDDEEADDEEPDDEESEKSEKKQATAKKRAPARKTSSRQPQKKAAGRSTRRNGGR